MPQEKMRAKTARRKYFEHYVTFEYKPWNKVIPDKELKDFTKLNSSIKLLVACLSQRNKKRGFHRVTLAAQH